MIPITSKLPQVGTTIFTLMSALAAEHNAINLGQGFPDYAMSEALIHKVHEAMLQGHNQYTHMYGLPALRQALATKYNTLHPCTITADDITITPGGTYAIYTALTALLQPLDEVIVLEPAYDCYIPAIVLTGAVPVTIPLQHPSYTIPWELVQAAITPRTRMILLNTPHNPTGTVYSAADMLMLQAIVSNTNLLILSDEVYEHLIFNNIQHQSVLRYPELAKRSVVTYSFGKTYNCTGWKLGYCIAPDYITKEIRKIHQFNAFTCNTPLQVALAHYITATDDYMQLGTMMQGKKDYFERAMTATKFTALPSYGSYFQLYSYEGISDLPEHEFAIWLTKQYGVTTIPVSAFYLNPQNNKVVRFCFAKQATVLDAAVERLMKL